MALFHHVENNQDICEMFSDVMHLFGHEIVSFANGLKYLEYMDGSSYVSPIAIFTDVDMPIMDGYEMIENVIEKYPNRLIVILSAHADRTNVNEVHVFQHMDKPFRPAILEELARSLIAKKLSLGLNADLLNV